MAQVEIKVLSTLAEIPAAEWNRLAGENPSLSHEYFFALEQTGCASVETGWQMCFLAAFDGRMLVGALPLYFKSHSYGEFVFDQAWAEAYETHGLRYYPKLVSSVPFTPISGNRILAGSKEVEALLIEAVVTFAKKSGASSFHCLFPTETQAQLLQKHGLMLRQGVQFHWKNAGYKTFDQFLETMRYEKRKKIRAERRKLNDAGISYERVTGIKASVEDWEFFYACYLHTHHLYQSPIPLSLEFFLQLGRTMPEKILLIFAIREGKKIAAGLDLFDSENAYGRSWGALEYHPGLHFEICYYQSIEFCIENKIATFEGGAQGEHKLARGFLPTTTYSAHWLAHPEFSRAVEDFLKRESKGIEQYVDELTGSSPFKG